MIKIETLSLPKKKIDDKMICQKKKKKSDKIIVARS